MRSGIVDMRTAVRHMTTHAFGRSLLALKSAAELWALLSAEDVSYDSTLPFVADNVQDAVGEVYGAAVLALGEHLADTTDAHHASAIGVTPTGGISSSDVQSALGEIDGEKLALAGGTMTGDLVINSGSEASLTANTGIVRVGNPAGAHLAIDANEVQAKASGTTTNGLDLNPHGGTVSINEKPVQPTATSVTATSLHANVASVAFQAVRLGDSVTFRCQINGSSAIGSFQTLCNLPAGWRPVNSNAYFIGFGTDGSEMHLEIGTNGNIVNVWGSAAWGASVNVRFNGAYISTI